MKKSDKVMNNVSTQDGLRRKLVSLQITLAVQGHMANSEQGGTQQALSIYIYTENVARIHKLETAIKTYWCYLNWRLKRW